MDKTFCIVQYQYGITPPPPATVLPLRPTTPRPSFLTLIPAPPLQTAVAADLRRFREEALVSAAHLIVLEQRARTSDPSLEHSYASSLSALAHIRAQWPTISPSLSRN